MNILSNETISRDKFEAKLVVLNNLKPIACQIVREDSNKTYCYYSSEGIHMGSWGKGNGWIFEGWNDPETIAKQNKFKEAVKLMVAQQKKEAKARLKAMKASI
jgi:hypothetical protein